jgi:hypothetical protein
MPVGTGIFMIDVIDMTMEEPDVVGTVHLVAANPQDAANKAMEFLGNQGVVDQEKRYHVNTVLVGPMPAALANKKVIAVSGAEAQAILKSGEIASHKR